MHARRCQCLYLPEGPEDEVVPLRYGRDLAVKEYQMHLPGYTVISAGV